MHNKYPKLYLRNLLLIAFILFESRAVFAKDNLRCTQDQKSCELENFRLTIGDKVGFFNENRKLIASGEVVKLRGLYRVIKIEKRYSNITANTTVRPIGDDIVGARNETFDIFQPDPNYLFSGGFGLVSSNISANSNGFLVEGRGDFLWSDGFRPGVHLRLVSASGEVVDTRQRDAIRTYTLSILDILATMSKIFWNQNSIYIKPEIGLGIAYAQYNVSGVGGDPLSFSRLNNGINLSLKASVMGIWRSGWSVDPYADISYTFITGINSLALTFGMSYPLM